MSLAYRCEVCGGMPHWRIERNGDAAVTWSCDPHVAKVMTGLQRPDETTALVVRDAHLTGG